MNRHRRGCRSSARAANQAPLGLARFASFRKPEPYASSVCPLISWVAFWHPACYKMTCEAMDVRRGVYLLLTVFLVQVSGLSTLCVPSRRQTHACCPMGAKTTLPNSSSLPDCCKRSLLNYQGSITEARNTNRPSDYTAQTAAISVPSAAPLVAITPMRQIAVPSASPPLSPLLQSCLLLI